jgi:hypothetical protein
MRGADQFARLFRTGQYGRLYIVSGIQARCATFRVFVLPPGAQAAANDAYSAPLNSDAVEVYDIAEETPGCAAAPGGSPDAGWQQEFAALVEARCAATLT